MDSNMNCWLKESCRKYQETSTCPNSCIKFIKLNYLYENAFIPVNQRNKIKLYADKIDSESFRQLKNIEDTIDTFVAAGSNAYIYSETTGNGKTSWSLRILQSFFDKIWPTTGLRCRALFISVPKFFISLKQSLSEYSEYIDHIKKNIQTADLVIWDDIGTKMGTEFECENLLNIIDNRISLHKSNIYTSNIAPEELEERLGMRLYSRIINNSNMIHLQGTDKRGLV